MTSITLNFTMEDWGKLVSAGLSEEIFRCIASCERVHRHDPEVFKPSIVEVADSDTEEDQLEVSLEATKPDRGNYSTKKTAEFAAKHNIIESQILSPSGKNGKITMGDVKKVLPPKKRGRKPKAHPEGDMIDSMVTKS